MGPGPQKPELETKGYIMKKALTALALIATAGTASASNYFGVEMAQDSTSYVPVELVNASGDGIVEIRDFRLGEAGELLGTTDVHAGANHNLKVNIGTRPLGDVIAILKVDGQIVATQEIDITR